MITYPYPFNLTINLMIFHNNNIIITNTIIQKSSLKTSINHDYGIICSQFLAIARSAHCGLQNCGGREGGGG